MANEDLEQEKPPKHFVNELSWQTGEATWNIIAYLQQTIGKPVYTALKGLKGV